MKAAILVESKKPLVVADIDLPDELEFGGIDTNNIFEKLNLRLIENTPEEISAVTVEMDERLSGNWKETVKDKKLQQKFWDLFEHYTLKSPDLRIGADYLRQNKHLLY
jgi:putative glycosyltransferase (TIGR04372 family)